MRVVCCSCVLASCVLFMLVGFVCFVHSFVRTRLSLKQGLKVRNAAHEVDLVVPDDINDRGNDHNLEVPRHSVQ